MAGDDHRAPFHVVSGNRHLPEAVQSFEYSRETAAVFQIDDGIFRGIENVARGYDVRAPEEDDAVTVGCCGLMEDLDPITVERQVLLRSRIGVVRPALFRH